MIAVFGACLVGCGALLLVRPLMLLGKPRVGRPVDLNLADFLDIVIEEQRAGQTPFLAVSAALNAFDRPTPPGPDQVANAVMTISSEYAALWRMLYHRGSGLLEAAITLRDGERERTRLREEVEVKVAATRSTIRLLLWLPWGFLIVGQLAGMRSLAILLTTPWGYLLIAMAAGLTWMGLTWVERILRSVQP